VLGLVAFAMPALGKWHVPRAPVRFALKLGGRPTHKSAGYFVHIPDGGILPRPCPEPHVVASNGSLVKSYVLWQNSGTGLGLVFEAPPGGDCLVYFTAGRGLRLWKPETGLTPSAILCTYSGRGAKGDALGLGRLGSVGPTVHYRNRAGVRQAPLSVPGDLSGRTGPCAVYMLAHVNAVDPGKTWVAPIVFAGGTEIRVDGKVLGLENRIDKPGGRGQWANLSKGLHRMEIFCWNRSGAAPKNGFMAMTWQTPKTSAKEMGGNRPSDLKHAGTPMWASRKLHGNEIVRSGSASVVRAEAQDGTPVASFSVTPVENFWLGNEPPLLVYRLNAHTGGRPSNTRYTFQFGGGSRLDKPVVHWMFQGGRDHSVALTVESGGKKSTCTVPFYPYTTHKTDMNRPQCRENFRAAALEVFSACPGNVDPTASWGKSHWNNFFRCMELNKGRELLTHIVNVRWEMLSAKLSEPRIELLSTIFLDFAPRVSPQMALKWTEKFEESARGGLEKAMMQVARADVHMFYLDDFDSAKLILQKVMRLRQTDDAGELARIRMGDLAFLSGDMNAAMKLYGEVQNRSKHKNLRRSPGSRSAPSHKPAARLKNVGLARSKSELDAKRGKNKKDATPARGRRSFAMNHNVPVAEWKMNALLDVSASETIKSLIEQGYLLEAKQMLIRWEREFPLSKLSGDYLINESKLLMAMQDWKRAKAMLEPYCDQVDASSFMPLAVEALLECKVQLQESDESIIEFCEKMKKKLEFHPAGQELADQLRVRR